MDNTKKTGGAVIVVSFLIGVLVGVGSYRLWMRWTERASILKGFPSSSEKTIEGSDQPTPETEMGKENKLNSIPSPSTLAEGENNVVVNDQPAGNKVVVANVSLSNDAWVAIHEDNNGKPGKILGARLFRAGSRNGEIELLRNTTGGSTYYAMFHSEDGDNKFDLIYDTPLQGSDGNPVMIKFKTQLAPAN